MGRRYFWEKAITKRFGLGHLKAIASEARLDPQSLKRKGRTARMVAARDRFICQAVWEEGYLASEVEIGGLGSNLDLST